MYKCKKCNDTGKYFSGYYSHPDTNGYDRYMPIMYKCECCKKNKVN